MFIDSETGLPKLPDNYYWEVVATMSQQRYYEYLLGIRKVYTIYMKKTEWKPGKYINEYPWYFLGFKKKVWVEGCQTEEVLVGQTITKFDSGENKGEEDKDEDATFVNPEILLKVTTDIFLQWEESVRKYAETQAVLGKYPPKTIVEKK